MLLEWILPAILSSAETQFLGYEIDLGSTVRSLPADSIALFIIKTTRVTTPLTEFDFKFEVQPQHQ